MAVALHTFHNYKKIAYTPIDPLNSLIGSCAHLSVQVTALSMMESSQIGMEFLP